MKIVVGLGNPGKKYEQTRHNVGFDVIKEIAEQNHLGRPKARFHGETIDLMMGSEKVILLSPLTYMNESGRSVRAACDFFQIDSQNDLLVICDDLNLALGKLRFRGKGSSGGQKGLADIIRHLGGENFARLRIGIGSAPPGWQVPDFVLSKFHDEDRTTMDSAIKTAAKAVEFWSQNDVQQSMNQFNGSGEKKKKAKKENKNKSNDRSAEPNVDDPNQTNNN